ncbi:asparagine synthetase B family protein [Azospirillum sp. Marseille-Q6669]
MARIAGVAGWNGAGPATALAGKLLTEVGVTPATLSGVGGTAFAGGPGVDVFDDGTLAVTVDGRIYNPEDLTEGGADGDAAVLAAGIRRFGVVGALAHVNGDFAVAIVDRRTGTVSLAVDRFGIKPLYHTPGDGPLAFASRPRSLLAFPGVSAAARDDYVAAVAVANYRFFDVEPTRSPYTGIERLPPGCVLTWRDGRSVVAPYAAFVEDEFDAPVEALAEEYAALLHDAVARRLKRAHRPAFTLSGGLDSSSVLMTSHRLTGQRLTAVSSVYDGASYDESAEIRDVVDTGACDWLPLRIEQPDLFGLVDRLVRLHDEPVATVTWLCHHLLVEDVRDRGFGSLFGGLGGDEQHAGEYDYFFYHFADLLADTDEASFAHEVRCWVRNHDHPVHRKSLERAQQMIAVLTDPADHGRCRPNLALRDRYRQALNPDFFDVDRLAPVYDRPFRQYLKSHSVNELTRNTMPCCLRASERNTNAAGIDDFFPFLDHRLVSFMLRVPGRLKIRDGVTKHFLRLAMRGTLPEVTRTRVVKTGWNAPAHLWFAGSLREPLLDLVRSRDFAERGIYRPAVVESLIEEHTRIVARGEVRDNHMMFLWQLLNLELWLRSLPSR